MTGEELNILSKIKVRPVEEQRDYLLEQNMLLTGKIATLEKENAELKLKLEALEGQTPWKDIKDKSELIKENAELKAQLESERDLPAIAYMQGAEKQKKKDEEELKKWKDEWQEQVQKATDEGYARTLQTMQLSKAKEIIREFVEWATWQGSNCPNFKSIQDKAEQFLSEVEK